MEGVARMNECIFCGTLVRDPTHGLKTKATGDDMCVITIRMSTKSSNGEWYSCFVEAFSYGGIARYIQDLLKKGMKVIAFCSYSSVREEVPEPFVEKMGKKYFNRPYFVVHRIYCTETPEKDDFAEEQYDEVFSGQLDKVMSNVVYNKGRSGKGEYDYKGKSIRYENNSLGKFVGKDEAYYKNIIDKAVQNVDLNIGKKEDKK